MLRFDIRSFTNFFFFLVYSDRSIGKCIKVVNILALTALTG